MAYLASELVTRSWYLSGIIAREFETPPGNYASEGLFLLNSLLDFKASDIRLIPYWTLDNLTFVPDQEMYFIDGLYAVQTITFNIGSVRYPISPTDRVQYFGTGRANGISSLPYQYHVERTIGGSNVYFYFPPQDNWVAEISGKYALTDVTLFTDLSTVYDGFYLEYLRYALARAMCLEWGTPFDPDKARMLATYEKKLLDVSPPDLSINKISLLNDKTSLNWAQVNLGEGWTP